MSWREEQERRQRNIMKWSIRGGIAGALLIIALIGWFAFTETINQGHAGVVYSRSDGVQEQTLGQGLKFVNPLWRITEYPVSTETVEYEDISLSTRDGKPLSVTLNFDYLNDVEKLPYIYNKFKGQSPEAIEDTWLKARLREASLAVTSKYTILDIFQNTENIRTEIEDRFREDVEEHGFIVENVVFGVPTPDEETQKSIQAVVNKQQELEALKIEQQKAEVEAETKLIEAEGQAQADIEKARGEAEANRLVSESITSEILKRMEMEARQQHGWITIQGASPLVEADGKK